MKPMSRSLLALAIAFASMPAAAGGLWLSEFNQPTMGRAAAGEEAGTGNASDVFFNAAAMTRHEGTQVMVAGGVLLPTVEFELEESGIVNGNGDGGDAGDLTPSLSAFYSTPYNDRVTWGIGGLILTGLSADYDDDWAGRFQAQEVNMAVLGLVPSVGFKVTDKLSLGLSVPVMYSALELDVAVPSLPGGPRPEEGRAEIDGDDVQVALIASFAYEITPRTHIGGRISSKYEFEYDGDVDTAFIGSVGVNTELTLASTARVGLSHVINERWTGYLSWGWDNWSEMDEVLLTTQNNGVSLPRNWEDTYHYGVGVDYHYNKRWTFRSGVAYDDSPVDKEFNRADMPVDEQWRYAVGADYLRDDGKVVSASLVYADYGESPIDSTTALPVIGFSGEFDTYSIWFFSVSVGW